MLAVAIPASWIQSNSGWVGLESSRVRYGLKRGMEQGSMELLRRWLRGASVCGGAEQWIESESTTLYELR